MKNAERDKYDAVQLGFGDRKRSRVTKPELGHVRRASAMLSRLGIIALVAKGYTLMAYGFLALFALPLLTYGVWRIVRAPGTPGDRPASST